MATKKAPTKAKAKPAAEPEAQPIAEPQPQTAEPIDPLKAKVAAIRALFSDVQIDGGPVDLKNPDHLIFAAYEVGRRGILRR